MFLEVSPYWNKASHKTEPEGTGTDSWDPGSLQGLFVQQNLLFCHIRAVTSEII